MYYFYILRSGKDSKHYIGLTTNLDRRVKDHNAGKVSSTRDRKPFELVYFEKFETKDIAEKREKFFKTGKGYDTLKNLLRIPR